MTEETPNNGIDVSAIKDQLWGASAETPPQEPIKEETPAPQDNTQDSDVEIEAQDDDSGEDQEPVVVDEKPKKRDPYARIKEASEKHKRDAEEARQQLAIMQHELAKYKELIDTELLGKKKASEPEKKEYLDEDLAKDTDEKLTAQEQRIFNAEYKAALAEGKSNLANPQEYKKAEDALVVKVMIDTLQQLGVQNGVAYDLKDLDETDFNSLANHAINQVETLKRQQFQAGRDPISFVIGVANNFGLLKPIENKQKPATLDIEALDAARRSTGKANIAKASAESILGGVTSKKIARELWG